MLEFVRDRRAVELVKGFPSDPTLIERPISLSQSAPIPEERLGQAARPGASAFEKVAQVPKGEFLYGDEKTSKQIDYDYAIDIYPVTNEQYRRFIEAGGYGTREHWSDEGWAWKERNKVIQPRYWDDPKWNRSDHPVVGVSYYEAEAYANLAGKRLPTEEEWEKAARGTTDGRAYPWGDEFDSEKCNSAESGIGGTTPVTKYVNGISPYGCYDMAGNVWEWTSSDYDSSNKVLRGGSSDNNADSLESTFRYGGLPTNRCSDLGFRCAQDAR